MKPIKQELPDRRKFLYGLGSSIGAIAFSNLLAAENTLRCHHHTTISPSKGVVKFTRSATAADPFAGLKNVRGRDLGALGAG